VNRTIEDYFDLVETSLVESAAVQSFQILRREISFADGKFRLKAVFADGSLIEMFEYIVLQNRQISIQKYSFHWQASDGTLISRWDNAPHHLSLPNAPHHCHHADGSVSAVKNLPDFLSILALIEDKILK
jgi:hypothetical protein